MEREYFDARFDGLKDLLVSQQKNLHDHIVAVSTNVHRLESDMNAHKASCPASVRVREIGDDLEAHADSLDAHGRRATDKLTGNIIAWVALAIAALVALLDLRKNP